MKQHWFILEEFWVDGRAYKGVSAVDYKVVIYIFFVIIRVYGEKLFY